MHTTIPVKPVAKAIEATDIRKQFGNLQVLKGVNLTVEQGEMIRIVGPSGAGKTTLLQILGTLERPDSGSLRVGGSDTSRMTSRALARFRNQHIGFVFQFHQLLPEFTAAENIMIPALIAGLSAHEARERATEILRTLHMENRATHKPGQLSGGEKQRIAGGRALVNRPSIILADEPSGSLDSQNKKDLNRLFLDLQHDFGQTFIIVTHDEHLALQADRTLHMSDGLL